MDAPLVYELIGYLASVLVAVSLMMSKILRLRIVNLLGAATFTVYGVLIDSVPVAAVNAFIVLVNLWYLRSILRSREFFRILPVRPGGEYLGAFLDFHEDEIRRHQPHFDPAPLRSATPRDPDRLSLFVLRDLVPAGLFSGRLADDGTLAVDLDFVIPSYRDFKVARFLFRDRADHFRTRGVRRVESRPGTPDHRRYLEAMGFRPAGPEEADCLVLELPEPDAPAD